MKEHRTKAQRRDRMVLWRDSCLPDGLELLNASCHEYSYPAHFHDEFVIAAFSSGAQRHRVSRWRGIATPGTVMIIPPGEVHTGEAAERNTGWEYCAFYPSNRFLNAIADEVLAGRGNLDFGSSILHEDATLVRHLLHANAVLAQSLDVLERQSWVYATLAAVIERYGTRTATSSKTHVCRTSFKRAIDFLQAHHGEQIALHDVAAVAGLSVYHFMRTFKAMTGLSTHSYLTQIRLQHAKNLLAKGVHAVEVATSVGLFDQSHLNRLFRLHFGITPGQYTAGCR